MTAVSSSARRFVVASVVVAVVALTGRPARAQGRDGLLNGAVIGAAAGVAGVVVKWRW